MNSRMERYNSNYEETDEKLSSVPSRVRRNNPLYHDIQNSDLTRFKNNDNVRVIETGKTIDLEKIKRYIADINDQPRARRKSVYVPENEEIQEEKVTIAPKDYNLNSVLEKAKQSREIDYDKERYKKLHDTQYDILSKLEMYEDKHEEEVLTKDDFNTEEKTLIDLINTVTIHKGEVNLLEELMGGEGETTLPINEEVYKSDIKEEIEDIKKEYTNTSTTISSLLDSISNDPEIANSPLLGKPKVEEKFQENISRQVQNVNKEKTQELVDLKDKSIKADDSFYTNSMSFSKEDFEGFDELEKSVKKNSVVSTILIVIFVIAIVASLVIIVNYVFKLGLF